MSVASQQPEPETYVCDGDGCDTEFTAAESTAGSFCSLTCYYRDKGAKILARLDADHRECSTCFQPVFYPRPVGRDGHTAYLPPSATDAVEAISNKAHPLPTYRFRTGCDCGSVNPADRHGFIRDVDDAQRRQAFAGALWRLAKKGAIDAYPDVETIHQAHAAGVDRWDEFAGRAIYGGET